MTNHTLTLADLPKFFLGFDRMQRDFLSNNTCDMGYPRFNIVKVGDWGYRVELAVPGWDKEDLDVSLHKNVLTIEGKATESEETDEEYLHKGLSGKRFTKTFQVGQYIKLESAYMHKGMLCIDLHEVLPESELPHSVKIK